MRGEWDLFWQQPKRFAVARELASRLAVKRVLDIGCGAGQELYPYLGSEVIAVGVDIAPDVGLFVRSHPVPCPVVGRDPVFVRAAAERLPFLSNQFDVIVCRVVLPCLDNKRALAEMARVLSKNGMVVLRVQAVGYYFQKILMGLRRGRPRAVLGAIQHAHHRCRLSCAWRSVGRIRDISDPLVAPARVEPTRTHDRIDNLELCISIPNLRDCQVRNPYP